MKRILAALALLLFFQFSCPLSAWAQANSVQLFHAGGLFGTYNSISAAWAAIPNPITGPVVIEMTPSYTAQSEGIPIFLTARAGASSTNTITVRPAANVDSFSHSSSSLSIHALLNLDGADHVIIDGRPGGLGTVGVWTLNVTSSAHTNLALINGASHNRVQYMKFRNAGSELASRGVFIGGSSNDPDGNSFNIVEHCWFAGARTPIHCLGVGNNPNRKNVIQKNDINTVYFAGIWVQSGTRGITIDSNRIQGNHLNNGPIHGILFDQQTDTAIISNNHILNLQASLLAASVYGIYIRTTESGTNQNVSIVYNNRISLTLPNNGATNIMGIAYGGSAPIRAQLYHNTVYIGGSLSGGGTIGVVVSAAFQKAAAATNTASHFDIRNNLWVNARTGGSSGVIHAGLDFANANGTYQINANSYNVLGTLGRLGLISYNLMSSFATALGAGNESLGNTRSAAFNNITDLQLVAPSTGDSLLGAPPIIWVRQDALGNYRNTLRPYRGAHEPPFPLAAACSGNATPVSVQLNAVVFCPGDSITLSISSPFDSLMLYQWQEAPLGSSQFTNLLSNQQAPLRLPAMAQRQYRCLSICPLTGQTAISNLLQPQVDLPFGPTTMLFTPQGFTVTFEALVGSAANLLAWDFDDGNRDTGRVVTHTFAANRLHAVKLFASNACFSDSARLLLNITGVGVAEPKNFSLRIWPNPARESIELLGDVAIKQLELLSLTGASVWKWRGESSSNLHLSLPALPPGLYLLQATDVLSRQQSQLLQLY